MPLYRYRAADRSGREIKGKTEAGSELVVETRLREAGYFPTEILPSKRPGSGEINLLQLPLIGWFYRIVTRGRVRLRTLESFTRELATLLGAGIPLLRSIQMLQRNATSTNLKWALKVTCEDIENGLCLSDALSRHPKVFNRLFTNMVRAGEMGGVLEQVLDRLANYYEKTAALRGKILSALYYPVTVLVLSITIVSLILTFIVPRLQTIYEGLGSEFPLPTLMLIRASEALRFQAPRLIGITLVILFVIVQSARTRQGKKMMDRLKLRLPIFGGLVRKASIARFSRTFSTLLHAGVPILQALLIVRECSGNAVISSAIADIHAEIRQGGNMADALRRFSVFPDIMVNMIDVGEETGALDTMLEKVAGSYERQVDNAVDGLTSLMEPLLIVFLGILIGFIVIALYLPLLTPPIP